MCEKMYVRNGVTVRVRWEGRPSDEAIQQAAQFLVDQQERRLALERARVRPDWLDAPPFEWPDAAQRCYDLCATAAERKRQRGGSQKAQPATVPEPDE